MSNYRQVLALIAKDDPNLQAKIRSPKLKLSDQILKLEAKNGLTQAQTAKLIGISLKRLLALEAVDLSISTKTYHHAISVLTKKCES